MGEWDLYGTLTTPASNDTLLINDVSATPPAAGTVKQITYAALAGLQPSGVTSGSTDTANIQALLTAGGRVVLGPGTFYISNMLQIPSGTCLSGAGKGVTTIKAASGSWSSVAQVNLINGLGLLITSGNTTASYIAVRNLTVDMNQTGITALPSWATGGTAAGDNVTNAGIHLNNVTNLLVEDVEVINTIGYTVYLQSCSDFTVRGCRVISGQVTATQSWGLPSQQDGIHLDSCTYGQVDGNYIDTGATGVNTGDDCVALQSFAAVHDISITNNTMRSDEAAVDFALTGADIYNISVTGNNIWQTEESAITVQPFAGSGALARNITISGNTISNFAVNGNSPRAAVALYDYSLFTTAATAWTGISITGNTIQTTTNTSAFGVYARYGTSLTVSGNTIRDFPGTLGIILGDNEAGTSLPVRQFSVTGNTVDMSTSAVTGCVGILPYDASSGVVSGNFVTGPGGNASDRIGISPTQASGTNLVQNISVSGNTLTGWDFGIQETNAGGGNPDSNAYTGNVFSSCTQNYQLLGTHNLVSASQRTTLQSAFTMASSASAQNVTGLAVTLQPGTWRVTGWWPMQQSAGTGTLQFAFTFGGTASAANCRYILTGATSSTTALETSLTALSSASPALSASGMWGDFTGLVTVTAAGTLQLQVKASATSVQAVFPVGAYLEVEPLA
ncbi:MAG TPA: right-handed parallel beta-helix repeat-containing protein [Acidobacteriaceae bacterium]|nr:right-handed parallel beta-helix repeat-containing protein [Acidobacteriaceae bacterium]